MNEILKAIGFWISDETPQFPHPERFVDDNLDSTLTGNIIDYLESGNVCVQWRGLSHCRFNCKTPSIDMGSKDLTDGYWVWPEGLSHYVDKHFVALPKEFIIYVEKNSWAVPNIKYDYNQGQDYDFDFWHSYCEDHITKR